MHYRDLLLFFLLLPISFSTFSQQNEDSVFIANAKARAVYLDSIVRNTPSKQASSFQPGDTSSLPIGIVREIGGVVYAICIDSARFTPQGATFDVYMAMDWPGAYGKLAFAAKGVPFNPKGVLGSGPMDVKLKLLGDQTLRLGPKNSIVFKGDGSNYIQWGCNGYERVNINADILFSQELIRKTDQGQVKANLQVNVEDLSQIMVQTTIDPFYVVGLEGFIFTINDLTIDRNSTLNPQNIQLPSATTNLYPDINNWTGFYAQTLSVRLPDKLSRSSSTPTTIGVSGLLIDDHGVSGDFFGTGIFSVEEGDMSGWGFSLDSLVLGIEYNHLTDGRISGNILVPQLSNASLKYSAAMYAATETTPLTYDFTAKTTANAVYQLPMFSSTLTLAPNCMLQMTVAGGKFVPSITLNGKLNYEGAKARLNQLSFQNLKLTSQAPYILGGTFSLTSANTTDQTNQVARLPLSLNSIGLGITQNQVVISAGISLKLGSEESSSSFGVTTSIEIYTKRETINNKERLVYDKLKINDILIQVSTNPFELNGVIAIRDDDPVYGDMFYGSIGFRLKPVMDNFATASVGFGKLNSKRYWYVDLAVPVNIPVGGSVMITNLFGGVQYGVESTITNEQKLNKAFSGQMPTSASTGVIPFVPNPQMGLGFSAGVALVAVPGESLLNGEAIFSIQFNANGGLVNINFFGRATMLVTRSQRNSSNVTKVQGEVSVNYDNVNKIFDASLAAIVVVPGILDGNCLLKIHVDQTDWYFWLNRPSNRASINVLNLFTANTYFMIGTQIDPLPPPPSYVTNLISPSPIISTDMTAVSTGQGFATGMMISASFGGEFPKTTKWRGYAYAGIGAGFDITMFKLSPTAHCSGSTGSVGFNQWYLMGQVYAWLNGSFGVRKYNDDGELKNEWPVASISAAALLQGRLPKPTFVYGAIALEVRLLGIIDLDFTADIELGNDCAIVN